MQVANGGAVYSLGTAGPWNGRTFLCHLEAKVSSPPLLNLINVKGPTFVIGSWHKGLAFQVLKLVSEDIGGDDVVVSRCKFTGTFCA